MDSLYTFFSNIKEKKNIPSHKIIIFYGELYPALFMQSVVNDLRYQKIWSFLEVIDLDGMSLDQLFFKLESSFLGMEGCYWIKNVDQLKNKDRAIFLQYLAAYVGRNTIIFWIKDDGSKLVKNQKIMLLEILGWCDKQFFTMWISNSANKKVSQSLISMIFQKQQRLSFDMIALLAYCFEIMDEELLSQFNVYIDRLLLTDHSLFVLSDYFFRKKIAFFFKEWKQIAAYYPDVFWISFWSDQLWRAYYSKYYMQQNNVVMAKKIAYRLPFSFLQNVWKQCSLAELRKAYNYLYALECALKSGNNAIGLDLFYTKFFLHQFTQKNSDIAIDLM